MHRLQSLHKQQTGIAHLVAIAVVFVAIFGLIGYQVISSHAATVDPADLDQTDSITQDDSTDASAPASCPSPAFIPVTGPAGSPYWLNPNRYGGGTMCPKNTDGKTDFTIVSGGTPKPNNGQVQAFPDIIAGCSTEGCINGSGYPKQASSIGSDFRSSASFTTGASGEWDAAYDIWFNKTNNHGPSKGTEILIMLNEQGKGFPPGISKKKVSVDGVDWWYLHYQQHSGSGSNKRTWNFVEFRRVSTTNSTSGLKLVPFFKAAENSSNGSQLDSSWYITGVDTGFEIWGGGLGLALQDLSVAGL